MTCESRNNIDDAPAARWSARPCEVDALAELAADVIGDLLEVEHLRCAARFAPVVMVVDVFTWQPLPRLVVQS